MSGKRGEDTTLPMRPAICEAVQRPRVRFVPVKTEEQQSRLMARTGRAKAL